MSESRISPTTTAHHGAVFSAERIARLMASSPEQAILPTPEQAAVIEQPLADSVLVIAGAGSGKTETMANRVVWLIANGLAEPSQILGLTFTRKAAGELAERIIERLQRFTQSLTLALETGQLLGPAESARARELHEMLGEGLDLPEVSTYNAFASAVVQEFGAQAGLPTSGTVIDQATAWGIAREIVCSSDDPGLVEKQRSIASVVKQVLGIDHAVSENLTSFAEVVHCSEQIEFIAELPYSEKKSEGQYADIRTVLENMRATRLAVRLAERYAEEKLRRGVIEFSDQLALAVRTLRNSPEAIRALRNRYPVVLLDEVQDTSVGQTALLSTLFAGNSVMAVGDPHQSIYGFRGASASNLRSFHADFGVAKRSGTHRATTLSLSTSWRNPGVVLSAANTVSEPLAQALEQQSTGLEVKPLTSRSNYLGQHESDDTPSLEVRVSETLTEEFSGLAEWMREARNEHLARTGMPPTAAVLFRNRRHMPAVSAALWQAGVPNRIVGLGGLLSTPEVTDLVSALRCIWHADASDSLIRLLAGPRFRLGVADLKGLRAAARWFSERDHAKQRLDDEDQRSRGPLPDPDRHFTLLDALDEIASLQSLDHAALRDISLLGSSRLREAGGMLRELRGQLGSDILALLRAATQALRLDIELDANESTGHEGSAIARANLDAFTGLVEGFLAVDEQGTLASVLAWLERASEDDEAAEHVPEAEPGTVQLITVHGSKGLEWDLVAIPRLVDGEFPSNPRDGVGWLRAGELPDELRGDAAARPRLDLGIASTQKQVIDSIERYKIALQQRHLEEERRLAYVAITRAASRLLLTASFWGGQSRARTPAVYLRELEAAGLIEAPPLSSAFESDPGATAGRTLSWPGDPLGRRGDAVRTAAGALREAIEALESTDPPVHPVVELLLAERDSETAVNPAPPPDTASAHHTERLTASTFHEFIEDPIEAERRRLRPMPVRPYRRTRTGNLFHEWVERRHGTALGTSLMLVDFEPEGAELDGEALASLTADASDRFEVDSTAELTALIENFERSRWADRQPIAVELEITLPFAGRSLVCKLDAVYRGGEGEQLRYEIVDWKSGRPPTTAAERESRFLQLDLYRHAYARWAAVDPEVIDVTLFYVAEGQELRGEQSRNLEDLERLWREAERSLSS